MFLVGDDKVWNATLTEAELKARVARVAGADTDRVLELYRARDPKANLAELLVAALTGGNFWVRSVMLAERKVARNRAPVYFCAFDWATPAYGGRLKIAPRDRSPVHLRPRMRAPVLSAPNSSVTRCPLLGQHSPAMRRRTTLQSRIGRPTLPPIARPWFSIRPAASTMTAAATCASYGTRSRKVGSDLRLSVPRIVWHRNKSRARRRWSGPASDDPPAPRPHAAPPAGPPFRRASV